MFCGTEFAGIIILIIPDERHAISSCAISIELTVRKATIVLLSLFKRTNKDFLKLFTSSSTFSQL